MTVPREAQAELSPSELKSYVAQTTKLLGLTLPESIEPGVVENFARLIAIAQPVLEFEVPDTVEPAPTFEP